MSRIHRVCARVLGAALALSLFAPVGSVFAQDAGPMVDMQGIKFIPQEIHVAPGATVMWMNSSPLAHTVTADDGSFDSGNMDAGATFSLTFDAPGIYTYYCAPHKSIGMIGTVVVDDPGAATESAAPDEPVMEPDPGAEPAAPVANPLPPRDTNPTDYYPDH